MKALHKPSHGLVLATKTFIFLLFSIAAGQVWSQEAAAVSAPEKTSTWERSAAIGFSLTDGNSDTLLLTANVLGTRKWDKNEWALGANGTYGENDGEKNNESVRGFSQYNRLFTDRVFGYLRLEALHDDIADVDYRVVFSPGAGYYFIKNTRTSLRAEVGPGVIYEKQGGDSGGYYTLRLAERFEHKFNDKANLWQSVEWLPQVDDFNNYILNAEIGVETVLTKLVNLRVYVQDTYDNEPAPGRTENDVKLVSAVAIKF